MEKLYVILRNDLDHGPQIAQAIHGFDAFREKHPERYAEWKKNIIVLQVPDEPALQALLDKLKEYEPAHFREPDYKCEHVDGELTCISVVGDAHRLLSQLPCAGSRRAKAA